MNKKVLISISLFIVLLLTTVSCFANINLESEIQSSANRSEETLQNAGDGIKNIATDIGAGIKDTAQGIGNGIEDVIDGSDNDHGTGTVTESSNEAVGSTEMTIGESSDYAATRTSTDMLTGTTMTNTAWVWLILGIVGIAIVALTWYYVSQNNDNR